MLVGGSGSSANRLSGVVIYFFWPETRGKTLEEVAAIFEGEEAMRAIQESAQRDIEIVDDKKEAFVSVKAV